MATRFRLTNDATDPAVSPAFNGGGTAYTHDTPADVRRKLLLTDTSALTTVAYTPDAADHGVAGDALHCQFVSDPMAAGNVFTSGDTLKMAVQGLQANLGGNQFMQIYVAVWDEAGTTLQAQLRQKVVDNTEWVLGLANRFLSTTLGQSYTTVAGDRLVVEISSQGTPGAGGGVQGHNASMRWGGNGAGGDLGENDTDTGTTLNPWIEFLTTITFGGAPATSLAFTRKDGLYLPLRDADLWNAKGGWL